MINTLQNTNFLQSMDLFNEINDFEQFLIKENIKSLDCSLEKYQDLENKYSHLNDTYVKEIESSKKVEKCLVKCLKFYSKLCKKYEVQQKIIASLEDRLKEKVKSLEESLKTQEKLKGLLQVYATERSLYSGASNEILRKEKEILLDICCRLISESVKTNNIKNVTNLILRKFKKDLDDEKLYLLKGKEVTVKKEVNKVKECDLSVNEDSKPGNFLEYEKLSTDESNKINCKFGEKGDLLEEKPKTETESVEQKLVSKLNLNTKAHESITNCNEVLELSNNSLDLNQSGAAVNNLLLKNVCDDRNTEDENSSCEDESFETVEESDSEIRSEKIEFHNSNEDKRTGIDKTEGSTDDFEGPLPFSNSFLQSHGKNSIFSPEPAENRAEIKAIDESVLLKPKNVKPSEKNNLKNRSLPNNFEKNENSCKSVIEFKDSSVNKTSEKVCDDAYAYLGNLKTPPALSLGEVPSQVVVNFESTSIASQVPRISEGNNHRFGTDLKSFEKVVSSCERLEDITCSPSCDPKNSNEFSSVLGSKTNGVSFLANSQDDRKLIGEGGKDIFPSVDDVSAKELAMILQQVKSVRLLSPIKDFENSLEREKPRTDILGSSVQNFFVTQEVEETLKLQKRDTSSEKINEASGRKRIFSGSSKITEFSSFSKKFKSNESEKVKKSNNKKSGGLLDSIMSAMSIQNEDFKVKNEDILFFGNISKVSHPSENVIVQNSCLSSGTFRSDLQTAAQELEISDSKNNSEECESSSPLKRKFRNKEPIKNKKDKTLKLEKVIMEEIKNFVSTQISSKEEAEKNVKNCISVLQNKSEEIIARTMLAIVFENIDEAIEIYERPAPPLTRTQHRLMVLLSVLKTIYPESEKISSLILSIIPEKLFPDNFFWPDDCVEMATRFFAALCRSRNDARSLWKLCIRAMTEMKQRCCLVIFTALKTWPDVLYVATTGRNNIVVVTVVNLFLHMPKEDGQRNFYQKKKLMALKHLFINFYQFEVQNTMETFASKVFDAFLKEESGSEKAIFLLAKCNGWSWTNKNILPELKKLLRDWSEKRIEDAIGNKILSVIKQICGVFLREKDAGETQVKENISFLSGVIFSTNRNHDFELSAIDLLFGVKQYPEARKVIREWVPTKAIDPDLRNQIINVCAENIFCDIKFRKKVNSTKKNVVNKKGKRSRTKRKKGKK